MKIIIIDNNVVNICKIHGICYLQKILAYVEIRYQLTVCSNFGSHDIDDFSEMSKDNPARYK